MTTLAIGNCPVYFTVPRHVEYELPFRRYWIKTWYGTGEINVSCALLKIYAGMEWGERLAVAMTAWGNVREQFRLYQTVPERNKMRDAFIAALEFERRF